MDFELGDLDSSPWFYDSLQEFLRSLYEGITSYNKNKEGMIRTGVVYEWKGFFRNYKFTGYLNILLDVNKK
jgi:hypothetical protein